MGSLGPEFFLNIQQPVRHVFYLFFSLLPYFRFCLHLLMIPGSIWGLFSMLFGVPGNLTSLIMRKLNLITHELSLISHELSLITRKLSLIPHEISSIPMPPTTPTMKRDAVHDQ